jgi:ribonuclease HI
MITIFTDGAAKGNPGPGGYGVVMKYNQHRKNFPKDSVIQPITEWNFWL